MIQERPKVFVSYSRADVGFADELELALRDKGFEPLIDRHGIVAGEDWKQRLSELILACDTVVFILTDASANSDICAYEAAEAERLGKRMLAVTLGPVSPGIAPPPQLARINWIHCWRNPLVPGSNQTQGILELDRALRADLGWLRKRTVYQEQATRWRERGSMTDSPHLLRGDLITEALAWVRAVPAGHDIPSEVSAFIASSEVYEVKSRAEAASQLLRELQQHVRIMARAAQGGTWSWHTHRDQIDISDELRKLFGASKETLTFEELLAFALPDDHAILRSALEQVRSTHQIDVSFRIAKNTSVCWLDMIGAPTEVMATEAAVVVGSCMDVTAKREAEARANSLQLRLRDVIDSFPGPCALWDARRRLLHWNKPFGDLLCPSPNVLQVGASYDSIASASATFIASSLQNRTDLAIRLVELKSGEHLQIQERLTSGGGMLTIGVDITVVRRHELQLIELEGKLRDAITKIERSEQRHKEISRGFEERKRAAEVVASKVQKRLSKVLLIGIPLVTTLSVACATLLLKVMK